MKTIFTFLLFALSIAAYGEEQSVSSLPQDDAKAQPDFTGERLKQLLRTADELEKAGRSGEAAEVRQIAHRERGAILAHIESLQAEIKRLHEIAGGAPQVFVHLKVYEVSMTKLRRLGYNLAKLQGKAVPSPDEKCDLVVGGCSIVDDGSNAARFFESLRKDNLAKVIAEPTLTVISGYEARLNCGGKIPQPKLEKDGAKPQKWQPYGTQVELTPTLVGDQKVRLSIHFQTSALDYANSVRVGKETVPGVRSRDFATVAELHAGQTLAFCGMEEVRVETSESGIPIASSIPYIGSAFKSVKEERNETAMFVLVRPEIPQPANDADNTASAQQPTDVDVRR